MNMPCCTVHKAADGSPRPMKLGNFGYFCTAKLADGTYCTQKGPKPAPAAQVSSTPVVEPQVLPKVRLAEAALAFAGAVYQGSGPVGANEALVLAQTAYKWLCDPSDTEGLGF
jgi:hypothetical protein